MFFTQEYQEYKQKVSNLFTKYIENRDIFIQTLNQQDKNSDEDLEIWKETITKYLERNKYFLVVAGEASSGKSSFINGLLKKQILPTDIVQCTSAIVDIVDTDNEIDQGKVYLEIKYADDKEKVIPGDTQEVREIREKLQEIVAVPEKYQSIPFVQLNQFLIEDKPEEITDEYVQKLINLAKERRGKPLENRYQLEEEDFKSQIKQYLDYYRDLSKIPVTIKLGYPLGFDFKEELHIIDTPGVNAEGGLQQATLDLINGEDEKRVANAIIFINRIRGNVDSQSFTQFVRDSIRTKKLNNSFIFLTDKTSCTEADIETALRRVKNSFKDIKRERIIAIDSMFKIIYERFKKEGETLEDLCQNQQFNRLIGPYFTEYVLHGKIIDDQAKDKIAEKIKKDSNYEEVETLLQEFFSTIDEELSSIVDKVSGGYEQQKKDYEQAIDLLESKISKTPQQFDQEIAQVNIDLGEYRRILNDFSSSQRSQYTGLDSDSEREWSSLKTNYINLLQNTYDELSVRKFMWDFDDEANEKFNFLVNKLTEEYTKKMEEIGIEFENDAKVSPPSICLEAVSNKAKNQAMESVKTRGNRGAKVLREGALGFAAGAFGGIWGGPPGVLIEGIVGAAVAGVNAFFSGTKDKIEQRVNPEKYYRKLKQGSQDLVSVTCDDMLTTITELFDAYNNNFQERLNTVINEREQNLDALAEQRKEIEPLYQRKEEISSLLQSVEKELKVCQTLKEN